MLIEGLYFQTNRGDSTPIELFSEGDRVWEPGIGSVLSDNDSDREGECGMGEGSPAPGAGSDRPTRLESSPGTRAQPYTNRRELGQKHDVDTRLGTLAITVHSAIAQLSSSASSSK